MERLAENPRVQTVRIESDDRMDGQISNQLADLFADTDAVTIDSQLEMKASADNGIGTIQAVGKTLTVLVSLPGAESRETTHSSDILTFLNLEIRINEQTVYHNGILVPLQP